MSSWGAEIRRLEAAQRRNERDARKRQKELERRLKEQTKLSALEQARLEVEAHENALRFCSPFHKEQNTPMDWGRFASALPPHEPPRLARHELLHSLKTPGWKQRFCWMSVSTRPRVWNTKEKFAHWDRLHSLAQRVLAGEARAYTQAVSEFPNLAEISNLGSSIHMTVHDAKLIECELKVNGRDVIPADTKSLTAAGKVAVKPMPKARFHEIYQDYVLWLSPASRARVVRTAAG